MFEFQRQHPIAAVSRAISLVRGNIVTILVLLFVGARSESFPFLMWMGGGFALLAIIGLLDWWRFLFKVQDGELHIKRGILIRKNLYLTKDRVQVIDISSGVVQRMFGLVKVDIQTAGSTSRAAMIEAVPQSTAAQINKLLSKNGVSSDEKESEEEAADDHQVYGLPGKDLLIAASTSGRFGIALSILGTLFSQIEPAIRESELFDKLINLLPSQTDGVTIAAILVLFIVVAWLISFFSTLFMYGDFSVEVREDELVISRGIIEKKRITVPYNRIQALFVTEGLLRQPLGYCSVNIHSAGYGDEAGSGSIVLFPLLKISKVKRLLEKIVPHYNIHTPALKPPRRAIRRYIIRSAFLLTAITAILYWLLPVTNWIWLIPALSVFWGVQKYKDAAIGWENQNIIISNRSLSKKTAIIKRDRIQDVSVSSSWIQKFRNLCSSELHVASGDHGSSFSIEDIEKDDGRRYLEEFFKQREEQKEIRSEPADRTLFTTKLPAW
ncbi:MAG: PH domain-containing protein [Bacteroidetes bacterium]|jgi:putative membrane protein|nr:PH domain-containing protein [Bacteroidota bacterium]